MRQYKAKFDCLAGSFYLRKNCSLLVKQKSKIPIKLLENKCSVCILHVLVGCEEIDMDEFVIPLIIIIVV